MSQSDSPQVCCNKSELVATFTDYDDNHSPYEGLALKLSLCADTLFVYVGKLTEGVGQDTFTHDDDHSIGVDAEALYETLGTMLRRADRHAAERAREGSLPADHPSWTSVPLLAHTPATRRRA